MKLLSAKEDFNLLESKTKKIQNAREVVISFLEPKLHFIKNSQLKFCSLMIKYLFLSHNIEPTGIKTQK